MQDRACGFVTLLLCVCVFVSFPAERNTFCGIRLRRRSNNFDFDFVLCKDNTFGSCRAISTCTSIELTRFKFQSRTKMAAQFMKDKARGWVTLH